MADSVVWTGDFLEREGEKDIVNSWLASLTGNGPLVNGLLVITSNVSQDFLVIPEPATITLLGLGVLAFLRKRKA